jgi:hypothetical protein
VRSAFIDVWKEEWPVEFLCRVMRVTSRGFRAWRVPEVIQGVEFKDGIKQLQKAA